MLTHKPNTFTLSGERGEVKRRAWSDTVQQAWSASTGFLQRGQERWRFWRTPPRDEPASSLPRHYLPQLQGSLLCVNLCGRKPQCAPTGCSHNRSHWLAPRIGPGSGRRSCSCCSDPGSRAGPPGWPSPSAPGPERRHSAAESGYIPGSLSAATRCLLTTHLDKVSCWCCTNIQTSQAAD